MALDFIGIQTEVYARGFAYLNDGGAGVTRVKRWINDVIHDIDDSDRWQYLMASTSTAMPATIADLDQVEAVTIGGVPLEEASRAELVAQYGDLTVTGTPLYYYVVGAVINVYPVATSTAIITYWKVAADLSGTTDVPSMPDRFRYAIVEATCAKAFRDKDDLQTAAVCQAEADRIVERMRSSYAVDAGPQTITVYGYASDW